MNRPLYGLEKINGFNEAYIADLVPRLRPPRYLEGHCHDNQPGYRELASRTVFHATATATASRHRVAASPLKIRSVDRETRCR
jgi:hypothetical protein